MKRIVILITVAVALFVTAIVVVRAETRGRHGWCGQSWRHRGPAGYLAHQLKLSDAQRAQIGTLWQAERPAFSAHVHELLAENKEMNAVAGKENPDPAEVQKIANREATTIAALLAEKANLQSKIYSTVLNPKQRAKADALQKRWESRLDRFADRLGAQPAAK
jgi:Spy/CpxP family protein refolding chaperone